MSRTCHNGSAIHSELQASRLRVGIDTRIITRLESSVYQFLRFSKCINHVGLMPSYHGLASILRNATRESAIHSYSYN